MGLFKPCLVLGLVLLLQTCGTWSETDESDLVLSLHPPYMEEETVVERGLLGTWVATDPQGGPPAGQPFVISNPVGHTIAYCSPAEKNIVFYGRMIRLNGNLFIAFRPGFPAFDVKTAFSIPGYLLVQIDLSENLFRGRGLEKTKVAVVLATTPESPLAVEDTGERMVITSPSDDYRSFLSQISDPDEIFGEWGEWFQKKSDGEASCPMPGPLPVPPQPSEEEQQRLLKETP